MLVDLLTDGNESIGKECSVALTRARAQKQKEAVEDLSMLPYFGADLKAQPGKPRKSKKQKKLEKLSFAASSGKEPLVEECVGPVEIPREIGLLQQEDSVIGPLYRQAQEEVQDKDSTSGSTGNQMFIKDGVLYNGKGIDARTVVPRKARDIMLELGHSLGRPFRKAKDV